jgi:uncharacterized repeat protein (TIGR04052 family)
MKLFKLIIPAFALMTTAVAAQTQPVTIKFAGEFAGKPFACAGKVEGVGASKASVTPTDFRLYVSNVALVRADGIAVSVTLSQDGKWQHRDVALLDFETGAGNCVNGTPDTRDVVVGTVPAGQYNGLKFTIGVPFDLNHNDPTLAASPLNLTSMFWTWQGGYKFIKIDMNTGDAPGIPVKSDGHSAPQPGDKPAGGGFSLHLGSTMCQSSSKTTAPSACANSNRIDLSFDTFDPTKNIVVLDPAAVLASVDVTKNTPETSPGCMSFPKDPECNTVMPKLGLAYGEHKAEAQAFARAR